MRTSRRRNDEPSWSAAPFVPASHDLDDLAAAADGCRGCPLFEDTTQTVFGEGSPAADLVLVGEQPGDREDLTGHVFVGPAGGVLRRCLDEAGIDVERVWMTNAVKHFKHERRGPRRLHKKPGTEEIDACRPWLEAELIALPPAPVVALGATAARSLLGRTVSIGATDGQDLEAYGRRLVVTYHPSAVLRADEAAAEIRARIVRDLRRARP